MPGPIIALFPSEDDAQALALSGGLSAEDLHITLLYLGKELSDDQVDLTRAFLPAFAERLDPLEAKVTAVSRFTETDDKTANVLLIDGKQFPALRQGLVDGLSAMGIETPSEHGFIPHITLSYSEDERLVGDHNGRELVFPAISFVRGDEIEHFGFVTGDRTMTTKARVDAPNYHKSEGLIKCVDCIFNDPEGTCNRFSFEFDTGFTCDDWQPQPDVRLEGRAVNFTKIGEAVLSEIDRQFIQPMRDELDPEAHEWIDLWGIDLFDDHIIVGISDSRDPQNSPAHFSYPYTIAEDGTITLGDPTPVEIIFRPLTDPEPPAKGVVSFQDLPLADRDRAWDGDAARMRLRTWAGGPDLEDMDFEKYRRGFLWYDAAEPSTLGSYKLPIADVIDGEIMAIPNGIIASAGNLQGARGGVDIPDDDQETIKNQVSRYYGKMREAFDEEDLIAPWDREEAEAAARRGNALKAVGETDTELIVENYIVLFGGRDLSGIVNGEKNEDGSVGEFFTKNTELESPYTKSVGRLPITWEHGEYSDQGEPGRHEALGYVDWKTAKIDDTGVFVQRVLDRRNRYIKMLKELIEQRLIGSSSEAIPGEVQKAPNGELLRWLLSGDALTVAPMEPRNLSSNTLATIKALVEVGVLKAAKEIMLDGGPSGEDDLTVARLKLKQKLISLQLEIQ